VFKQGTGMTPHQFVTRERMLQAQQLIRETYRSLIEIASATPVQAISLRYFGGRQSWLPLSSATPFSAKISQAKALVKFFAL
jgi:hypothetical protein